MNSETIICVAGYVHPSAPNLSFAPAEVSRRLQAWLVDTAITEPERVYVTVACQL